MIKRICFFLLMYTIAANAEQSTPRDIYARYKSLLKTANAMSYKIHYRMKFFSDEDTLDLNGQCYLIRDAADTVINGAYYIEQPSGGFIMRRGYNNNIMYYIDDSARKISTYKVPGDRRDPLSGNVNDDIIFNRFFYPDNPVATDDTTAIVTMGKDSVINGIPCYKVFVQYPFEDGDSGTRSIAFYSKSTYMLVESTSISFFQGDVQYRYMSISDVVFDGFDSSFIKEKYPKDYTIEPYIPKKRLPLLTQGDVAPEITAKLYPTGRDVKLSDHKGKVVLLDFFFTTCGPCIEAIPKLENLHTRYADQDVVVIGIDPYESVEKDEKKLKKFFKRNTANYPIYLTDASVPDKYHIQGYPTVFIIDKEGVIRWAHVGYGEGVEKQWEEVIKAALAK